VWRGMFIPVPPQGGGENQEGECSQRGDVKDFSRKLRPVRTGSQEFASGEQKGTGEDIGRRIREELEVNRVNPRAKRKLAKFL